jgi:DNA-binding cell septation regulator SpoVG
MSSMILHEFRPMVKNSLRGFATVEMPNGLVIKDISVLTGRNGPWCSLPAKPAFGADGRPKTGPTGRAVHSQIIEWRDRDLQDRWSAALVALIEAEHPGALDGGV